MNEKDEKEVVEILLKNHQKDSWTQEELWKDLETCLKKFGIRLRTPTRTPEDQAMINDMGVIA